MGGGSLACLWWLTGFCSSIGADCCSSHVNCRWSHDSLVPREFRSTFLPRGSSNVRYVYEVLGRSSNVSLASSVGRGRSNGVAASSPDACLEGPPEDGCVLPLAADGCRCGISSEGRVSKEEWLSNDGRASGMGLELPLLRGREKFVLLCDPFIENSDVIEGDRCIDGIHGEKGDCGLDMPLLPENLRDEDTALEPLVETSSSPESGGTDRMLCILRGDFGKAGDLGGARDLFDRVDPSVSVRGCVDCTESTLLVKLGMFNGEAACT